MTLIHFFPSCIDPIHSSDKNYDIEDDLVNFTDIP